MSLFLVIFLSPWRQIQGEAMLLEQCPMWQVHQTKFKWPNLVDDGDHVVFSCRKYSHWLYVTRSCAIQMNIFGAKLYTAIFPMVAIQHGAKLDVLWPLGKTAWVTKIVQHFKNNRLVGYEMRARFAFVAHQSLCHSPPGEPRQLLKGKSLVSSKNFKNSTFPNNFRSIYRRSDLMSVCEDLVHHNKASNAPSMFSSALGLILHVSSSMWSTL